MEYIFRASDDKLNAIIMSIYHIIQKLSRTASDRILICNSLSASSSTIPMSVAMSCFIRIVTHQSNVHSALSHSLSISYIAQLQCLSGVTDGRRNAFFVPSSIWTQTARVRQQQKKRSSIGIRSICAN